MSENSKQQNLIATSDQRVQLQFAKTVIDANLIPNNWIEKVRVIPGDSLSAIDGPCGLAEITAILTHQIKQALNPAKSQTLKIEYNHDLGEVYILMQFGGNQQYCIGKLMYKVVASGK